MRLLVGLACGLLLILGSVAAFRLRARLNVTGTVVLPGPIESLTARDRVAYPAHIVLGSLLETFRYPSPAVGVQWLKAAYHARDGRRMEEAIAGIATARGRSSTPGSFDATLCQLSDTKGRFDYARTRAGVLCPEGKVVSTWDPGPPDNTSTISVLRDKVENSIKDFTGWR